jgi:hypothetical protein
MTLNSQEQSSWCFVVVHSGRCVCSKAVPPILVDSSPSWRNDLPSRFRSSHGRRGIGLHAVYQEKKEKKSTNCAIRVLFQKANFLGICWRLWHLSTSVSTDVAGANQGFGLIVGSVTFPTTLVSLK